MAKRILSAIVICLMTLTAVSAQHQPSQTKQQPIVIPLKQQSEDPQQVQDEAQQLPNEAQDQDALAVKDYLLNVGDFSEFTVADNLNILYKFSTDSAGLASFSCDPRYAHAFTFTNKKGKVKIEVISDNPVPVPYPTITIYSSCLAKVTNQGDSTICLLSLNPGQKLGLKVVGNGFIQALGVYTTSLSAAVEAGSGHVYVSGQTQEAKITLAGVGSIEAGSLKADKASVWMLGTGSVDCSVASELSIYGAGTGTLYYVGDPKLKKRAVGVKLVKMDE